MDEIVEDSDFKISVRRFVFGVCGRTKNAAFFNISAWTPLI